MPHSVCVRAISSASYGSPRRYSRALAAAVTGALTCAPGLSVAQEGPRAEEEVIVTATRRTQSIQEVPFNIAAVSGESLQEEGITDLADLGRTVPGLYVVDQGPRTANRIVVRGLNISGVTAAEALGNDAGEIVSTYVGEIPVYIDLKPDDLERVEVLLGPQGTLYGAGTLGGAIRYIPMRPQFDASSVQLRGRGYTLSHSDGLGSDAGFTVNLPVGDNFALRASLNYLDDPGFVDYDYLVREPGISDPQPDPNDPSARAANLRRDADGDDEQTLSGRFALRARPMDTLDINLTYYFQDQESGGRTATHKVAFDTGRYEFATRYPEPNDRRNELLALEAVADLGFAELTSATAYSEYREHGERDQSDFLIALPFDPQYEAFPSFSAFSRDKQKDERFNQELRLVSKTGGRFDWIAGAFYNHLKRSVETREFSPLFSDFLVSMDPSFGYRPDGLDYIQLGKRELEEYALFGELTLRITDRWNVTLGTRWYNYDLESRSWSALPLLETAFGGDPDSINLAATSSHQDDSGQLLKINTSFQATQDLMLYATISEGYRLGGFNGAPPCDDPLPPGQNVCALPNEMQFKPDKTTNYEIGVRSEWLDGRLFLSGSLFVVDWKDPQLDGATVNGLYNITLNGEGARSQGVALTFATRLTEQLALRGGYSYAQAELTDDAPALLREMVPPGFETVPVDGLDGDRLPGSPEHQGHIWASYEVPWRSSFDLIVNYGLSAQSDVLTRTGGRAAGETLGGFAVHNASIVLRGAQWEAALYAKNLFDKYAVTGVRSTRRSVQDVEDINGDPVRVRSYYEDILRPREVGLRFSYDFEL